MNSPTLCICGHDKKPHGIELSACMTPACFCHAFTAATSPAEPYESFDSFLADEIATDPALPERLERASAQIDTDLGIKPNDSPTELSKCPDPKCLYCHNDDEAHMSQHLSAHHIFTGSPNDSEVSGDTVCTTCGGNGHGGVDSGLSGEALAADIVDLIETYQRKAITAFSEDIKRRQFKAVDLIDDGAEYQAVDVSVIDTELKRFLVNPLKNTVDSTSTL